MSKNYSFNQFNAGDNVRIGEKQLINLKQLCFKRGVVVNAKKKFMVCLLTGKLT